MEPLYLTISAGVKAKTPKFCFKNSFMLYYDMGKIIKTKNYRTTPLVISYGMIQNLMPS
jgi:hypothetical protein